MINSLFGLAVASYGVYRVYFLMSTSGDTTITMWGQALGAVLIGGGVFAWNSVEGIRWVTALLKKAPSSPNNPSPLVESNETEPIAGIAITIDKEKDIECCFYLAERFKDCPEGKEYCRKINDLLYSSHHNVEVK